MELAPETARGRRIGFSDTGKMRGKLVVGNWKMNGGLAPNAALLVALLAGWQTRSDRAIAVCLPFPSLGRARDALAGSPVLGARRM